MIVEQISFFIENKAGRLQDITEVLNQNSIDISALSLADTSEYGVLRMIVSDPHKAKEVLKENGVIGKVTDVLAFAIEDKPGGVSYSLKVLAENKIDIKYMYACVAHTANKAIVVARVDNPIEANEILKNNGVDVDSPSSIYRIIEKN